MKQRGSSDLAWKLPAVKMLVGCFVAALACAVLPLVAFAEPAEGASGGLPAFESETLDGLLARGSQEEVEANVEASNNNLPQFWDLSVAGDGSVTAVLDEEGLLSIEGAGVVKDLGWDAEGEVYEETYWGPYREQITSVFLDNRLRASSMFRWFAFCPNLTEVLEGSTVPRGVTDASELFRDSAIVTLPESFTLPDGLENAGAMFLDCQKLTHLPATFTLPEGLLYVGKMFFECRSLSSLPQNFVLPDSTVSAGSMFFLCTSLKELPQNFVLPAGVRSVSFMFTGCTSLVSLPESFAIPVGVEWCIQMFDACRSLTSLPKNFTIPEGVTTASSMFDGCRSLVALPEGFTLPTSARDVRSMFEGCSRLTSIPKGFTVPAGALIDNMFMLGEGAAPITYLGSDPRLSDPETWKQWNRV